MTKGMSDKDDLNLSAEDLKAMADDGDPLLANLVDWVKNFEGFGGECGEHRTVGPARAWCYACERWCYPDYPCVGCGGRTAHESSP